MTRYALAVAALAVALSHSTPIINNVDPAAPSPNTKPQVLTITGQDFMQGLTLTVSEPAGNKTVIQGKAITNQTATSFQAPVTLLNEGTYSLVVTNTDGTTSARARMADGFDSDAPRRYIMASVRAPTVTGSARSRRRAWGDSAFGRPG